MNTQQAIVMDRHNLSPQLRKLGHELLDHQCWAFGRDVLHRGGSLVTEYGFVKVPCPSGGMSQYELRQGLGADSHVYLWGFGTFFGNEHEGIFLARNGFVPFRTQGYVELHSRDYHPFLHESSDMGLLRKGIAWLAEYEDWVAHRMGESYRSETLKDFPRLTLPHGDLAVRWREFTGRIAESSSPAS